jgi:hypothetical protein
MSTGSWNATDVWQTDFPPKIRIQRIPIIWRAFLPMAIPSFSDSRRLARSHYPHFQGTHIAPEPDLQRLKTAIASRDPIEGGNSLLGIAGAIALVPLPFPYPPFVKHDFFGVLRFILAQGRDWEPCIRAVFAILRVLTRMPEYCRFLECEYGIGAVVIRIIEAGMAAADLTSTLVNLAAEETSELHRQREFWSYPIGVILGAESVEQCISPMRLLLHLVRRGRLSGKLVPVRRKVVKAIAYFVGFLPKEFSAGTHGLVCALLPRLLFANSLDLEAFRKHRLGEFVALHCWRSPELLTFVGGVVRRLPTIEVFEATVPVYPLLVLAAVWQPVADEMKSDGAVANACWALSQFYQKDADLAIVDDVAPDLLEWLMGRAQNCNFEAKAQVVLLICSLFRRMSAEGLEKEVIRELIELLEEAVAIEMSPAVLREAQFPITAMAAAMDPASDVAPRLEELHGIWFDRMGLDRSPLP